MLRATCGSSLPLGRGEEKGPGNRRGGTLAELRATGISMSAQEPEALERRLKRENCPFKSVGGKG